MNDKNEYRREAIKWLNTLISEYVDDGRRRKVFLHKSSDRLYFLTNPFDFDKDDIPYKFHFLDTFDGWEDGYLSHIKWHIL